MMSGPPATHGVGDRSLDLWVGHPPEEIEAVTLACLFEDVEEDGAGVVVVQEGKAVVATEGDEVVVT
jgi:hypothetical protein